MNVSDMASLRSVDRIQQVPIIHFIQYSASEIAGATLSSLCIADQAGVSYQYLTYVPKAGSTSTPWSSTPISLSFPHLTSPHSTLSSPSLHPSLYWSNLANLTWLLSLQYKWICCESGEIRILNLMHLKILTFLFSSP